MDQLRGTPTLMIFKMTKEEFCAKCGGDCCNIYEHFIIGKNIEQKHEAFFKDEGRFEVEPLGRIGNRCEYLGESGCIIKRENRPNQCLNYECEELKQFNGKERV